MPSATSRRRLAAATTLVVALVCSLGTGTAAGRNADAGTTDSITAPPPVEDPAVEVFAALAALHEATAELARADAHLADALETERALAARLDASGADRDRLVRRATVTRGRLLDSVTAAYVIGGLDTLALAEATGAGDLTDQLLRSEFVASLADDLDEALDDHRGAAGRLDGDLAVLADELLAATATREAARDTADRARRALTEAERRADRARFTLALLEQAAGTYVDSGVSVLGATAGNALFGAAGAPPVPGIPERAYRAYVGAADRLAVEQPGCRVPWWLLAGIGAVESGHGSSNGATIGADQRVTPPILGPVLNGGRFAAIRDTDRGLLDGDPLWDRAVGPMQFIPSTWRAYAVGDVNDPHNFDHAALAAGRYLCRGARGRPVDSGPGRHAAIFSYNRSEAYVAKVLHHALGYAAGAGEVVPTPVDPVMPPAPEAPAEPSVTPPPAPPTTAPQPGPPQTAPPTTAPPTTAPPTTAAPLRPAPTPAPSPPTTPPDTTPVDPG